MKKKTTDILINDLKLIYGDFFDYSKTVYSGSKNKFIITCPIHGDFEVRYDKIIHGEGCPLCRKEKRIIEFFNNLISRARKIHGNKYDYSKVKYTTIEERVCIICPEHGEFWQSLNCHVNQKQGCPLCANQNKIGRYNLSTQEFIQKAQEVHGNKYDYSQTVYNGMKSKLKIICPKHGEFWQVAYDHLRGFKCEKCKFETNTSNTESFIKKARGVHGDKYDYSKVIYINNHIKVCIICPEHGEFQQLPSHHLLGCGCQKCHSSRMERTIRKLLDDNSIKCIEQFSNEMLGKQSLDFYLPDYNIGIECQGLQHIKNVEFYGKLEIVLERDKRKLKICNDNSIKILYVCEKRFKNDFLKYKEMYNNSNLLCLKEVYCYDDKFKNSFLQKITKE